MAVPEKLKLMFKSPVNTLVRTQSEYLLSDTIAFAKLVLSPKEVKKAIPREFHADSLQLFVIHVLNLACAEPTGRIFDLIMSKSDLVDETKKITTEIAGDDYSDAAKKYVRGFGKKFNGFSFFQQKQLIAAAHLQWATGFHIPVFSTVKSQYVFTPTRKVAPDLDKIDLTHIRLHTEHDWDDAIAIAEKFLAPSREATDEHAFNFSFNLFVLVALDNGYNGYKQTLEACIEYLVDKSWDSPKQIMAAVSLQYRNFPLNEKLTSHAREWSDKHINALNLQGMILRAHTLWKYCLKQLTTPESEAIEKKPHNLKVFDLQGLGKAETIISEMKDDRRSGGDRIIEQARTNNGYRKIPDTKKAIAILEEYKKLFENLVEPIEHLQLNLALSGAMPPEKFRIPPLLLLGDPGIGKTMLAMALANSLEGKMEKITASIQAGWQLSGSHSSWGGSKCGLIFTSLAEGETTSPIFIIDEIDKFSSGNYPIVPVLLDLLEPQTACKFTDDFLETEVDASKIIFILTANDIHKVSEPLQSRVSVFTVPRPEPAQRLRVINAELEELCLVTGFPVRFTEGEAERLAERVDLDMRITVKLVHATFAKAMMAQEKVITLTIPDTPYQLAKKEYSTASIGFCATTKQPQKETEASMQLSLNKEKDV
jgi:ATP-dependent Lon protease